MNGTVDIATIGLERLLMNRNPFIDKTIYTLNNIAYQNDYTMRKHALVHQLFSFFFGSMQRNVQ